MTEEEIKNFVANYKEGDYFDTQVMADIMLYKAQNIKAHIPALIFKIIAKRLKSAKHNEELISHWLLR